MPVRLEPGGLELLQGANGAADVLAGGVAAEEGVVGDEVEVDGAVVLFLLAHDVVDLVGEEGLALVEEAAEEDGVGEDCGRGV